MPVAARRTPQQQRSRELVARVLDAAERLLSTGADGLSTTTIAQAAGVSVGALYQYFPDTSAIVTALATRHMDAFEALMEETVERAVAERWDDPVGALVDLFAARGSQEAQEEADQEEAQDQAPAAQRGRHRRRRGLRRADRRARRRASGQVGLRRRGARPRRRARVEPRAVRRRHLRARRDVRW